MLNLIWAGMVLMGVAFAAVNGTLGDMGTAAFDGAKEAVTITLGTLGVMGLWCGLMEIARQSGLLAALTKKLRPLIRWLFPGIPAEDRANEEIAVNFVANIFGLGNAATPAGLRAMERLGELHQENCRKYGGSPSAASNEMCTFLILNISSLQLLPVTLIAYRAQYGSVNPTAIVGPGIAATAASTAAAVVFCKLMDRKRGTPSHAASDDSI